LNEDLTGGSVSIAFEEEKEVQGEAGGEVLVIEVILSKSVVTVTVLGSLSLQEGFSLCVFDVDVCYLVLLE